MLQEQTLNVLQIMLGLIHNVLTIAFIHFYSLDSHYIPIPEISFILITTNHMHPTNCNLMVHRLLIKSNTDYILM